MEISHSNTKQEGYIRCKWVYKTKFHPNGFVDRYKTRLVAKGLSQTKKIDFEETFVPISKMTTLRVLIALGASKGWYFHQMDVHNAFLHETLRMKHT